MKCIYYIFFLLVIGGCSNNTHSYKVIAAKEYHDAVYASWLGQIIGNTYGLGYEFKFIDEPGPDDFPYGYDFTLDTLRKHDGAFSDDDTDIEYMYLLQMEKHGVEPNYNQLANAWKNHVKERVWFANRMAVTLMHAGHYPPVTGNRHFNCEWFQIDPQLVNEIWAVTAPGMVDYAVAKSEYAARITSDDFGLEPTLHYAAMYSAAFFEKDINRLIEIGNSVLPDSSRFSEAVDFVKEQYSLYPSNWQKARANVVDKYYVIEDYNRHSWAAVDAILNGALGVMSLLYGQGDFQQTLDYACAFGMDADNQAATICGLLGIVNGFESLPKQLMYPLEDADWELPFNDSYRMITRDGLSDARITELAERSVKQAEKIILKQGGEIFNKDGETYYKIPIDVVFESPFELNPIPKQSLRVGKQWQYPVYVGSKKAKVEIIGELPSGVVYKDGQLQGVPATKGTYSFEIKATKGSDEKQIAVQLYVFDENKAGSASSVLFNNAARDKNTEVIRDGDIRSTYTSVKNDHQPGIDYYGYIWDQPQKISTLIYNNGKPGEFYGWFTDFKVEYLHENEWVALRDVEVFPSMNLGNSQWLKPAYQDYTIGFDTLTTRGIRIIGKAGGIKKDMANAHLGMEYATAIGELEVY
ncbi:ADP-ribosylglycohydrolase family protein [Carboxylicivirga linearis]|uniref:ADP-ribosylglycohydrolase family protein n=1 Tax=Carboxylicivirga linearis TaxID=1628157 RepID=A0ABS5JTZ4_9BACT|nr:ADP-ribosylglycohydrolase family protein [Carboxylicivirga linearis]MBS2098344.1 ADP-ribosylglycohydrolase family protein [Carboxylicivirga linearis]